VTTVAGLGAAGYADGIGSAAAMNFPQSCKIYSDGSVIFSDDANYRVRSMTRFGAVTTLAGSGSAGFFDGLGSSASFKSVGGIHVDSISNIFVTDYKLNVVRKISQGEFQTNPNN
jgi:hypothetical protein